MEAKNANVAGFSIPEEKLQKILNSAEGKQLVSLLQGSGSSVQQAASAAQSGDMAGAKRVIDTLLKDPKTAALVERLRHG